MPDQPTPEPEVEPDEVDPHEFLRAVMGISPADAKKVRDASPPTHKRHGKSGPNHDHDDDSAD